MSDSDCSVENEKEFHRREQDLLLEQSKNNYSFLDGWKRKHKLKKVAVKKVVLEVENYLSE